MKTETLAQKIVDNISSAIGAIPRSLNFDADIAPSKKRARKKPVRRAVSRAKKRIAVKAKAKKKPAKKATRKTKLRLVKRPRARRATARTGNVKAKKAA